MPNGIHAKRLFSDVFEIWDSSTNTGYMIHVMSRHNLRLVNDAEEVTAAIKGTLAEALTAYKEYIKCER